MNVFKCKKEKEKEKKEKEKKEKEKREKEKKNTNKSRPKKQPPKDEVDFKNYHRYSTINAYLKKMVKKHKRIATLDCIGWSIEGREINMMRISKSIRYISKRPVIFIDAGIHGREWIAPATALYLIHQLLEDPDSEDMYEKFDWIIIPLVNPDGYEYSHTDDRFWRKNRRKGKTACGVDANRNYSFMWGQSGSSPEETSMNYRGKCPFSEPESRAIRNVALKYKNNIKLYLTLHSHGKMILHPWGYTKENVTDVKELVRVARVANRAIIHAQGRPYRVGSSAELLYLMSGGSKDYFFKEINVKYSYTVELPGGGSRGFDLPPEKIEGVVKEMFAGFRGFWGEMTRIYINK